AEAAHTDEQTVRPDKAVPALTDTRLDGDPDRGAADDGLLIVLILLLEQLETGNGDDARRMATLLEHGARLHRDLHFRAAGEDGHFRLVAGRQQLVGTACAQIVFLELRPHRLQLLASQGQGGWGLAGFEGELPAFGRLGGVRRAEDEMVWDGAEGREMLYGLMGRSVLAEPDRIMRHHEDRADAHERCKPHRGPRIVGEGQE